MGDQYYDEPDDDFDDEDEEDWWLDCGLGQDGQCHKAGSEECDWDCPHSHGVFYAGSKRWNERHDAGVPVADCLCSECLSARLRPALKDGQ